MRALFRGHQAGTSKVHKADGDKLCADIAAVIKDMAIDKRIITGVIRTIMELVEEQIPQPIMEK